MDSIDFGSLVIVGAIVSLIVQVIKTKLGTSKMASLAAVIVLSLIGGAVYVTLKDTTYWQTILQILMAAGAFYAFIIKQLEPRD